MRPPIRLAAPMGLHVVHVFTHDSLALGEDGPTHQPVEQLASLRAIPRLVVIRPADANETAVAWKVAVETRDHPVRLKGVQSSPLLGFVYFDTELVGGRLDALPRRIAFGIGDTVNLIEACNSIANMASVLERLLALSWKCKFLGA